MNLLLATATTEAADTLTNQEALVTGGILGAILGFSAVFIIAWLVLQIIADWKIFTKAGEAGWKSIIPVYNYYTEYKLCWNGAYGLVFAIASYVGNVISNSNNPANWQIALNLVLCVVMIVLHLMESLKLAKAFGKGTGFGIFLFILGPIARIVLGFGSAEYQGRP